MSTRDKAVRLAAPANRVHLEKSRRNRAGLESSMPAPSAVREALNGPSIPLDETTRTTMEARFGHNFSRVRVHTDSSAAQAAETVNAAAYTVGRDVVFGEGEYQPRTVEGNRLLAHELAHVVQQSGWTGKQAPSGLEVGAGDHFTEREADRAAEHAEGQLPAGAASVQGSAAAVRRDKPKKTKPTEKKPEKKPEIQLTLGEVRFEKAAQQDLLKGGSLLAGADNAHMGLSADGRLGYDASYTEQDDPFRWQKLKDIVDSGQKVLVKKASIGDRIKVRRVTQGKSTDGREMLMDLGLTLPTEELQRKIYPKESTFAASPSADTHHVYYTTDLNDPSRSALPHELFGHLWLALKGVPFVHPEGKAEIAARGTLGKKHGVLDPFGGIYTGTVKEFIDRYVGSEMFSQLKSPTQFVGDRLLNEALKRLKDGFEKKATGKLNAAWSVPDDMGLAWETISTNYEVAGLSDPKRQAGIQGDVAKWYSGLPVDRQYVFLMFLEAVRTDITRKSKLASELVKVLKKPAGMRTSEP